MRLITIIDYNAGNISSVWRALAHLDIPCRIESDADAVANAERLIFPGVGNAQSAMERLNQSGLSAAIRTAHKKGTPLLGICLGSQILLGHSQEGDVACLNLISGGVKKLPSAPGIKVPHMGWNDIQTAKWHPIFEGIKEDDTFYFVHSFYTQPDDEADIYARAWHGISFPVVIGRDNLIATQFHPEKSGPTGLRLLENFARWEVK